MSRRRSGCIARSSASSASEEDKTPYIIGVAGSVAVGKSTTARVLQALLARWTNVPKVDLVTTDGFLLPNAVLEREGLMEKKGFPESYDLPALLRFLSDVKAGPPSGARADLFAPDLRRGAEPVARGRPAGHPDRRRTRTCCRPAACRRTARRSRSCRTSSTSRSISTPTRPCSRSWYVDRFLTLRGTAFRDPKSYFHRYSKLTDAEASATATSIWSSINLVNLHENILPTRQRADLILKKGESHRVEEVALRKL